MRLHYDEIFGAGDRIVALGRATGTNKGPLSRTPAPNEAVEFRLADISRVQNGKTVECYLLPDLFLTMMCRMDLTPTP